MVFQVDCDLVEGDLGDVHLEEKDVTLSII